jgi:glycosyltransferase involved in cell wall biosynthesis
VVKEASIMHIALLTNGIYPYEVGGMQRHSYYLAKYLAQNNVYVDIYHPWINEDDPLHIFSDTEREYLRFYAVHFPSYFRFPGHYLYEFYKYSQRLYTIFQMQSDVDFIYAKGFTSWYFLKAKDDALPPIGVNLHGYEMFQSPPSFKVWLQHLLLRSPAKYNTRQADYVFSYGGKITDIIEGLGINKERILEIPTGIEKSWLIDNAPSPNEPRKLVFVGRYERRKGIQELNTVIKQLQPEYDFSFEFVGPIPPSRQIDSDNVKYWGEVTDTGQLQKIMQDNDILVCPSHSEGMPNVILEGMASGLAVIATDVGAVSVAVSEENGWLIDPGNTNRLKQAIKEALEMKAAKLQQKQAQSLKKVKEDLLWENIGRQTVRAIEKTVS